MKKIDYSSLINILLILFLLMVNNLFKISLLSTIIIYIITYIVFFIKCYKKNKKLKLLLNSSEFIYLSVFFFYSMPASIQFIIDGYNPRITYFTIDYESMLITLRLYYNIFLITLLLFTFSGGIKNIFMYNSNTSYEEKINIGFDIFDLLSLIITIYFYYLHLRSNLNLSSTYFQTLRESIQIAGNFNSYMYLYMIAYCFSNLYIIINDKKIHRKQRNPKVIFFFIISVMFWGISLLTDRRNLVNLLLIIVLYCSSKVNKIKLKTLIVSLFCVLVLLSLSYFRANTVSRKLNDVIFLSTGEFVLTNYVSSYYTNHSYDRINGSSYLWNTLTIFIPRSIYPNKPELLSSIFKKQSGINVAYAYNPVAEGIVNFGINGALIAVPIVLFLLTKFSYFLGKRNTVLFYIVCGESINFCRGLFSVSLFSILVISFFTYFILWFMRCRNLKEGVYINANY